MKRKTLNVSPDYKSGNNLKPLTGKKKSITETFDVEDQFIERRIVTGLIVSTDYIGKIRKVWNSKMLIATAAKAVMDWFARNVVTNPSPV